MIEQHQIETDVVRGGNLEAGVEILEEVGIEARRQVAIVVHDAGAAVAEDEPADHPQTQARHLGEVALDRGAACGDAEVRAPHVGAEVEAVEAAPAVGGPRVVAPVREGARGHFACIDCRYFWTSAPSGPL